MGSLSGKNTKIRASQRGEPKFAGDPERMKPSEPIIYYMDPEEIKQKYGAPKITKHRLACLLKEGKSVTEIGKMFGVPANKVYDLIIHYELRKNKEEIKMGPELKKAVKVLPKKQMIKYIEEGKTELEMAKLSGLTEGRIKQLKRFYCLTPGTRGKENEQGFNVEMLPKGEGKGSKKKNEFDKVVDKPVEKPVDNKVENKGEASKPVSELQCNCSNFIEVVKSLGAILKEKPALIPEEDLTKENFELLEAFESIVKFILLEKELAISPNGFEYILNKIKGIEDDIFELNAKMKLNLDATAENVTNRSLDVGRTLTLNINLGGK